MAVATKDRGRACGNIARRLREFTYVASGLLVMGTCAPVAAQTPPRQPPRVETGASVFSIGGWVDVSDFVGDPQLGAQGAEVVVRPRLTERVALEGRVGFSTVDRVTLNVYDVSVIVRRSPPRQHAWSSWLRFGAGGHREVEEVPETQYESLDRSITVYPGFTHYKVTPPNVAIVGMGLQRPFAKHAAFVADADVIGGAIGVGLRLSAGVLIPLGVYEGQ
jgi:hypothetical protein